MTALCTCIFPVQDIDAARAWYTAFFGVEPYYGSDPYVGFDVDGYELDLMPATEDYGPSVHGTEALWGVVDIQATYARALAAGATPITPPWNTGEEIWVAAVRDPFGNRLGLLYNPHFVVPPKGAVTLADAPARLAEGAVRTFTCEVDVRRATPAELFAGWTSTDMIRLWLAVESNVELRVGGAFELYFDDATSGARGSEGCRILSFIPDRMLSFTWNAPPHLPYTRERFTWVVLEFTTSKIGARLSLTHTGFPEAGFTGDDAHPQWAETWSYFQRAWPNVLEIFRNRFAR